MTLRSLRARLTISFLLAILTTAGLILLLANVITVNRFTHLASFTGQRYAWRLASILAEYYVTHNGWRGVDSLIAHARQAAQPGDTPRPRQQPPAPEARTPGDRVILLDADGRIIADSDPGGEPLHLSALDLSKGAPVIVGGRRVGTLLVISGLGKLTPLQEAYLRQINTWMVIAGILAALAVLLVSEFQARRIVEPVQALAQAAHRIAAGDLSQRIPVTDDDELGEMAAAFNTMAEKLERQQELRHRVMADIAHELRTPLSVLQIELESIEDGLTEPTPEVIQGLQTSVAHLRRLVEDLRVLSLAEAGELPLEREEVDLVALVREVAQSVQSGARSQGVAMNAVLPDAPLTVNGDRQRLAQVLLNLLSNALRHTPAGGQITVSVTRTGDEGRVSVRDTGEGIPAAALPHIFERFYRADRARSRDTGGSGLGLSIARSLIEAHGGRIWAVSEEGKGSEFTFALPLS